MSALQGRPKMEYTTKVWSLPYLTKTRLGTIREPARLQCGPTLCLMGIVNLLYLRVCHMYEYNDERQLVFRTNSLMILFLLLLLLLWL